MKKIPSSVQHWDSNPQPSEHESHHKTTRPSWKVTSKATGFFSNDKSKFRLIKVHFFICFSGTSRWTTPRWQERAGRRGRARRARAQTLWRPRTLLSFRPASWRVRLAAWSWRSVTAPSWAASPSWPTASSVTRRHFRVTSITSSRSWPGSRSGWTLLSQSYFYM